MTRSRFVSGVASGDAATTAVVLWGRIDGAPTTATRTLTDADGVVASTGTVHSDERGIFRVEIDGLRPGTRYRHQFSAGQDESPAAAPAPPKRSPRPSASASPAARDGRAVSSTGTDRSSTPMSISWSTSVTSSTKTAREATVARTTRPTSDDYDRRYAQYRTDADLQALHAAAPWVATPDDHEIDDNVARVDRTGRSSSVGADPERRRHPSGGRPAPGTTDTAPTWPQTPVRLVSHTQGIRAE